MRQRLHRFLGELAEDARILDLGGGTGVLARWAKRRLPRAEVWVADPSEGMLRRVPGGIRTVRACAEALPFEDDHFDAVLVGEALHHFQDPERALDEIARVLRSGGHLFIYEYDPRPLPGRLLRGLERVLGEPGRFYPPERLASRVRHRGFDTEVEVRGFRYLLRGVLREKASGRSSPSV